MINNFENLVITEICGIYEPYYPNDFEKLMANRASFGISFCIKGKATYTHNGKKYTCDKNHAVFLPKDATYLLKISKDSHFTLINFCCCDNFNNTDFHIFQFEDNNIFLKLHEEIKRLSVFDDENNHFKIYSKLYRMFSKLFENSVQQEKSPILTPVLKFMEENISNPNISNKTLSDIMGYSEVYFRKLFKSYYGLSPIQYLINAKINKAKIMLESGIDDLYKVADECGYSNIYYFIKSFKNKTGYSPKEYSELNKIDI